MPQVGERYRPDYDLHLVKLVAMHYGVTITELGFTETGGLGSTGYHEGQEDIQFRKGRLPDLKWYGALCTQISRTHLHMPDVLEFSFLGLDDDDEAAADAIDHQRLADGRITLNEARLKIGQPALEFDEANMPMLETARGVVFLEGASEAVPAGTLIEPASENNTMQGPGVSPQAAPVSPTQRRPISSGGGTASKEALDEFRAYLRWLAKPGKHDRKFHFEHLTEDVAKSLGDWNYDLAEFAKAGGSGPKASSSSRTSSRPDRSLHSPLGPGQDGSTISAWSPYTGLS
jgi:hypothetical protein